MSDDNPLKNYPDISERLANFVQIGKEKRGGYPISTKQIEVVTGITNGKSATQAVRDANYSPSVIDSPAKVINSRGVAEALDILLDGRDIELAKENLKIMKRAHSLTTMQFPYYPNKKKTETEEAYRERVEGNVTDEQIRELLSGMGGIVKHISNNFIAGRTVFYYFPDNNAKLKALELIYKVKGSFSATKTENKNTNVNFSPAMLREEAERRAFEVIDSEPKL